MTGCASQLAVTYDSSPQGAALYTGGEHRGFTPKTLYYDLSGEHIEKGYIVVAPVKYQWASGAAFEDNYVFLDFKKYGMSVSHTAQRPDDVPGIEKDLQSKLTAIMLCIGKLKR